MAYLERRRSKMGRVHKAIRQQAAAAWASGLARSKFAIGFVIVVATILSWGIYKSADSPVSAEKVSGELIGIHQVQGNTGSSLNMLAIRLKGGNTMLVPMPVGVPIKPGAKVLLSVTTTEQGSVYYKFNGYQDQ